jgi:putative spermidine/putrescine transport system permease protein
MTSATTPLPERPGLSRRLQTALYPHRAAQILLLLAPPVGWFGVIYLGSLAILFVSAF